MKPLFQPEFERRYILKWTGVAFLIKAILFVWFAFNVYHHWEKGKVRHAIAGIQGDTKTYYNPAEDFVKGEGYTSICRMPGILPLYAPVSYLLGKDTAEVFMIIIQFICSTVSVVLLAWIATVLFRDKRAFPLTMILYGLSTFVSIWDHFLMSDSLSIAFLIFSVFFLIKFLQHERYKDIFFAGLFITWSVFLRQIDIVIIAVTGLILLFHFGKKLVPLFKAGVIYMIPFILCIGTWTWYNYQKTTRVIPLIAPFSECFKITSEQFNAIGDLIRAWGENSVHWTEGSSAQWMLTNDYKGENPPISANVLTSSYNLDSLIQLKKDYNAFQQTEDIELKENMGKMLLAKTNEYKESYIQENAAHYYFLNRIQLIRRFMLPGYIDNVPGPPYNQMNVLHKMVKGGSLALLMMVSIFGIISLVVLIIRKDFQLLLWALLPWSLILTLACYFGYIEQRYLAPAYPFLLIFGVYVILVIWNYFFLKKQNTRNG